MKVELINLSIEDAEAAISKAVREFVPVALKPLTGLLEEFNRKSYLLKEFITCQEASDYVEGSWSAETIRRYVNAGKIPGAKTGNLILVHRPSFEEMLRKKMEKGTKKSDPNKKPSV